MNSRRFVILTGLLLLLPLLAWAQTETTGQISGDVLDPSGAAVSGAKITVTSAMGWSRETTSDASGHYNLPLLPPGKYLLQVTAAGFAPLKAENVVVLITQTTELPLRLSVAGTVETVNVTAEAPLVTTEAVVRGKVIEENTIRQLPLSTRNFQQLLALTTGASGSLQNSSELGRGDAVIFVNGQRAISNAVVVNGVDANSIGTGSTPNLAVPASDSLQEFIVQTSLYDATQGRNAGGVVAAVTKSGTNAFHGNLYYFLRNTALNSNNFFLERQGIEKPVQNRNQFGATFGGPLKKDRAWFFVSYQGTREKNGASLLNSLATVFTPANLPQTRSNADVDAFALEYGVNPLFVSPAARALLQAQLPSGAFAFPSPSVTVPGSLTSVATPIPTISRFTEDQFNANLDVKVSEANNLSIKFFWADNPTEQALYSFAGSQNPIQAPGFGADIVVKNRLLSIGDTHIFTPNLLNDFRFGYSTSHVPSTPHEPLSSADVGMASPLSSLFPGMATVSLSNMMDVGTSPLSDSDSRIASWTFRDSLTWTHGKHTLKFGGEYKRHWAELAFNGYTRGQTFLTGALTPLFGGFFGVPATCGTAPSCAAANTTRDFLLGWSTIAFIGSGINDRTNRTWDLSFFLQDDWRIHPRFTLNLGVRYDYFAPFTEEQNRYVAFDPDLATTVPIPGGVAVTSGFVQAAGGTLSGIPTIEDSLVPADKNNFAPRVGFSWQVLPDYSNLVLKGGYGMYFDRTNARLYNTQVFNAPYYLIAGSQFTALSSPFAAVPTPDQFPLDFADAALFPFGGPPAVLPITPMMAGFPAAAFVGMNALAPNRDAWVTPYVQQFNFGLQWGFAKNWGLDIAYVGSKGTHQTRLRALNQPPSPTVGGVGPFGPGLSSAVVPVFGAYVAETTSKSRYDSLQTTLTKRMSWGLQFLMSYTWAHSFDTYSGTDVSDLSVVPGDQANLTNNYAQSDFDRRHRFVLSYSYDLPKLYQGDNGFAKRIANDWQINGILTLQSGAPFTIMGSGDAFRQTRADLVAGASLSDAILSGDVESRLGEYFETSIFALPTGAGNFGTTPRNWLRGPNQRNFDVSFVKFIPLTERQRMEFRTEFFNLFNTVNFANPINLRSSSNFGQIVRTSTGPRVIQFALKYSF